jgi:hypothetical protein
MCGLLLFNMYYDGWFCLMCIEFMMGGWDVKSKKSPPLKFLAEPNSTIFKVSSRAKFHNL